MRKILLAGALAIGLCSAAWGQNAVVNFKTSNTTPGSKPVTDNLGLPVNCILGCSGGGSVTQGTSPWIDSISFWNGVALGSPSVYGTSPGAVIVPGVNAFVTNAPSLVSSASSGIVPLSANLPTVGYNYLWDGALWDQATGLLTGTVGAPGLDVVTVQAPITLGSAGFPVASVPLTVSATGTTAAVVATLAANATKTTYICGFSITSDATAGLSGNATIAGLITGTMTFIQGVGVAPAVAALTQNFSPCIPASTINTTIVITSAAAGTLGTTAVNAWGFQQ